jgi:acyl-CoA synthetase (AMP-forming)/AMP-acid ligase II
MKSSFFSCAAVSGAALLLFGRSANQGSFDETCVVDPNAKVDALECRALPDGTAGAVIVRGHQVMKGAHNIPENMAKAVNKFGWFDTGHLGWINPATGDLILTGRAKDPRIPLSFRMEKILSHCR